MAKQHYTPLPQLTQKDVNRFWKYAEKRGADECWPWNGYRDMCGYGRFIYGGGRFITSRISYLMATEEDPGDMSILHSCDFPACCNPQHLRKGSQVENIKDRNKRGRTASGDRSGARTHPEKYQGECHGSAKLSDKEVLEIRRRYDLGERQKGLANEFGVSREAISGIGTRRKWKHL